ncbi:hypothetical protein FRX31_018875 [Thalictrum thalictroides]|uniref:Uncharacterized protein n=1 Tax=Thalictrum thalictroides TaxID=46969 RepID=A0A7J6W412_THATH|nr:hypothetical protein FRX31_018875 [Thalictrum thalictroides]
MGAADKIWVRKVPVQTEIEIKGATDKKGITSAETKLGATDNNWVRVPGQGRMNRPEKEKSWAQVVSGSRYEPIREVVEETQEQGIEPNSEVQVSRPKYVVQQLSVQIETQEEAKATKTHKTLLENRKGKALFIQKGPSSSGHPSLRLSKQLWPNNKTGGKLRMGRIKQLARQTMLSEYQRLGENEKAQQLVVEIDSTDSTCSVSSPFFSKQFSQGEGSSQKEFPKLLKQQTVCVQREKEDSGEGSGSVSCPPGFETKKEAGPVVNFGALIDQECSILKTTGDVDEWVNTVIGPISKNLGLSSTRGDEAIKKFFMELGHAKLKERKTREGNEDESEQLNYELCNEEFEGHKFEYG